MLNGSGLPLLSLPALLQFGITALAIVCGVLFVLRNAASRYFMVDAGFEGPDAGGYGGRGKMSYGDEKCFVCGRRGTKKCARCKSVRYCSQECQAKHWKDGHRHKCKEPRLLNDNTVARTTGRRKISGPGSSIALIPSRGSCKVLEQPKKILFPYEDFVKLFNWDKQNFPPCGLLNCGNSCFANVVLQCLVGTRPLVAYLLEGSHSKTCRRNDWCFLCELQNHIKKVTQSSRPFSPLNILSRLPKIGGNLGHGSQEDAHEFMRLAVDTMQSICLDEFGGEKSLDESIQQTTLIHHIFGGQLQSQVKCTKCGKISNRYEKIMDLTVEIQGDAESLEECLKQFTGEEWLDGENMYKCDGCAEYVKAWKRLAVHQPPNVLTVALKRFQGGRFGKLNKRVTFPEILDLRPYMSGAGDATDLYALYAVVVHIDMLNASFFGHYICYTKDFYGNWYRVDDCKVTKVDVDEVLSQGAYMLLYGRVSARLSSIQHPDTAKAHDEKLTEAAPASLAKHMLDSMADQSERELCQREVKASDCFVHAKPDLRSEIQATSEVNLTIPRCVDMDKTQEVHIDKYKEMDLDRYLGTDSCKAVANNLDLGNPVVEPLASVLSEETPFSLEDCIEKGDNTKTYVSHEFVKESSLTTSDELSTDSADASSIYAFSPDLHETKEECKVKVVNLRTSVDHEFIKDSDPVTISTENFTDSAVTSHYYAFPSDLPEMTEPIESNICALRSGHRVLAGLHDSFPSTEGQKDLLSENLETPCSHSFHGKGFAVEDDMNIANGDHTFCGHHTCNQLNYGSENCNCKQNVKPIFSLARIDNQMQGKPPDEETVISNNGVVHLGDHFAGIIDASQFDSNSDGRSSDGCPEPFSLKFLEGHAQGTPPNGKWGEESRTCGVPYKVPVQNDHLDYLPDCNGNGCDVIYKSSRSSPTRVPKTNVFPFLKHHDEMGFREREKTAQNVLP